MVFNLLKGEIHKNIDVITGVNIWQNINENRHKEMKDM